MKDYVPKYVHKSTRVKGDGRRGFIPDPSKWLSGPDPVRHDKYYAYLKHRAQAKFRGETYNLTFDEFANVWEDELWFERGRSADSMCLSRIDFEGPWETSNIEVMSRGEHLKKKRRREYKLNGR